MATVFMKWLERRPETYDRGIQLLTLGQLNNLWDKLTAQFIREDDRVLELGCGTGGLTLRMAKAGAEVTAIDVAPSMLAKAIERVTNTDFAGRVQFTRMDSTQIGVHFPEKSFDLIVTSLMLSELSPEQRDLVLQSCASLLDAEGKLVILDEVVPSGNFAGIIYHLFRKPLSLVTWLLTKTTTHPIDNFQKFLKQQGYHLETTFCTLAGSLCLVSAIADSRSFQSVRTSYPIRLQYKKTVKTVLMDLWAIFFRILPPYPKQKPGLYSIGQPDRDAPVLVTGNYTQTIRSVTKSLDGKMDAWLLVVDSAGINVWCAAGGGFLTADKVISTMKLAHLDQIVDHRDLVLPQLAAVGVDGGQIRAATSWNVRWGPVKAEDLPAYVEAAFQKTEPMRTIGFPLLNRLEMVTGTLSLYGLMVLIPIAIFWRHLFFPTAAAMIALSYFYAIFLPRIPGRDGLAKAIPLTALSVLGVITFSILLDPVPGDALFNRVMGISALSIFIAGEFQGMSPRMRGEQANWVPEAMIGAVLGLVYWLLPKMIGWR